MFLSVNCESLREFAAAASTRGSDGLVIQLDEM